MQQYVEIRQINTERWVGNSCTLQRGYEYIDKLKLVHYIEYQTDEFILISSRPYGGRA
jgi:hypothetical protein